VDTGFGPLQLLALRGAAHSRSGFRLLGEPLPQLWDRFDRGELLLVSEPLATRHGLAPGNRLRLETLQGARELPIGAVFQDYGNPQGMLLLQGDRYAAWWDDPRTDTLGVLLDPAQPRQETLAALRGLLQKLPQAITLDLSDQVRAHALEVFDRTFTITSVLRLLAIGVAFIGVLSALLALQLERRREHAVLRATGMEPGQLRTLIAGETALMGLLAGVLALPLGWLMAEILIQVINLRSFGWSIGSVLPPVILLEAVLLALVAALLAGLYPAWRIGRMPLAQALREE
jgi:putative ABC transport system permease protein